MKQLEVSSQKEIQRNHIIEGWRDKLLSNNDSITEFVDEYPKIDLQMTDLSKNAQKEKKDNKGPKYSRQLFKLIKDIVMTKV